VVVLYEVIMYLVTGKYAGGYVYDHIQIPVNRDNLPVVRAHLRKMWSGRMDYPGKVVTRPLKHPIVPVDKFLEN